MKVNYTGIFFKVSNYNNEIIMELEVDEVNDDSPCVDFFNINQLSKKISAIAIMELEQFGYKLN